MWSLNIQTENNLSVSQWITIFQFKLKSILFMACHDWALLIECEWKCVQFIQFPLIARLCLLLLPLLEIQGANLEGRLWRQWPHVIVRNVTLSSNIMSCLFVCCRTVIQGWLPCVWNHWLIRSKSESNWSPSETIISLMTNIIPLRCSSFYFGRHCFYQYEGFHTSRL